MLSPTLTKKLAHRIGRIDQCVRDHFENNMTLSEIPAKNLMALFIAKGIFYSDPKKGLRIREILRNLDATNQLHLLKHSKAVRKNKNSNWYFVKTPSTHRQDLSF